MLWDLSSSAMASDDRVDWEATSGERWKISGEVDGMQKSVWSPAQSSSQTRKEHSGARRAPSVQRRQTSRPHVVRHFRNLALGLHLYALVTPPIPYHCQPRARLGLNLAPPNGFVSTSLLRPTSSQPRCQSPQDSRESMIFL